jgi:hypothetical protein
MDHDELVNRRVHAIARAHDCSIDDVNAALDRHPIELNCDADLKRALALELMPAAGGLLIKGGGKTCDIAWPESAYRTCGGK